MPDKIVSKHIAPTLLWSILIASLMGVIVYHMPWHSHVVAAFRLNGFDLAEWATLHPTIRAENPTLWSSMLFRLPLLGLAWSIALTANHLRDERWQWIGRGVAVLVVLRLNPPLEFYKSPTDAGANEQQLGTLMLAGLFGVVLLVLANRWLKQIYFPLVLILWLMIGITSWEGLRRTTQVVESLAIEVSYGGGFYIMLGLVFGVIGISVWQLMQPYLPQLVQLNKMEDNNLI